MRQRRIRVKQKRPAVRIVHRKGQRTKVMEEEDDETVKFRMRHIEECGTETERQKIKRCPALCAQLPFRESLRVSLCGNVGGFILDVVDPPNFLLLPRVSVF